MVDKTNDGGGAPVLNPSGSVRHIKYGINAFDLWALGITIVIGGQYFSWNLGLTAGFGSFFISTVLVGFSYICLCSSTSELSSAIPFAGGAYGLARSTLGFYM
jgi:ethanolamine permease